MFSIYCPDNTAFRAAIQFLGIWYILSINTTTEQCEKSEKHQLFYSCKRVFFHN